MTPFAKKEGFITYNHIRYYLIGTLALSLLSILNFSFDIGKPFPGFLTRYNNTQARYLLNQSTPRWWLADDVKTLDVQDKLLAINDVQLTLNVHESTLYQDAFDRGEKTVKLTINQMGKIYDIFVPLKIFSFDHFIDFIFPNFITGFGFWLIALVIYQTKIDSPLNRTFILFCLLVAANSMLVQTAVFDSDTPIDTFFFITRKLIEPFIGFQLIRFARHYPTTIFAKNRLIDWLLTIIPIVLCLLIFWENYSIWVLNKPIDLQLSLYVSIILFGSIILGFLTTIFRLIREGLYSKLEWQRHEALIFLAGLLFTLPYMLGYIWGFFLPITIEFWQQLDLRYLTLCGPIGFAIGTLRYQTFKLNSKLFLVVPAISAASISTGTVTHLWRTSIPLLSMPTPAFVYLATFGLFLFMLLIWIFQSYWDSYFSRLLNLENWSYNVLQAFPRYLVAEDPSTKLPDNIVEAYVQLMDLEFATLWLPEDAHNGRFNLLAKTNLTPITLPITLFSTPDEKLVKPLHTKNPLTLSDMPNWLIPLLAHDKIEYIIPLRGHDQLAAVLAIGKRIDGGHISFKDIGILTQTAQTSAMFLISEQQTNTARAFPNQIAKAQERERLKIARELHDTIQQFLGRLPFYLETSRDQITTNPEEADKILAKSIREVEQAAKTVREIRNNLAPYKLELGLIQPVEELTKRFEKRTNIKTQLIINEPSVDNKISLEARHVIYRVIQQALDNVAEHAQATTVKVELNSKQNHMKVAVEDNGIGYKKADIADKSDTRFGLLSMATRIQSLGGEFAPVSIIGKGTRIVGTIPYQ